MSLEELKGRLHLFDRGNSYPERLETLKRWGRDTSLIEKGVAACESALTETDSFVVYGEPQSGKTEFMIALVCRLLDLNKQTIFVVMNDNTELESQNYDRFLSAKELNPAPLRDFELYQFTKDEQRAKKQRVVFCRKNSKNLQKLIEACRFMEDRVVIDDEADYATPNGKINKDEQTAINRYLGELGQLGQQGSGGVYIGVTATPARLDLNNTYCNDSMRWVFLESHENYKGRSFFFPQTTEERQKSDYQLVKLPDDTDKPELIRHAVFRFMLRTAYLNSESSSGDSSYSMLIHTSGLKNDHEKDQKDVQKILSILQDYESKKFDQYLREILKIAEKLVADHEMRTNPVDLAEYVIRNAGRSKIFVINDSNDSGNVQKACQPAALFTFAIGGNIVSRGLTFERLLTFYFSRNVKTGLQQNTYIQRARMFGNRPYSELFELCVPAKLFNDWSTCFHDHEMSVRLGKAGVYQHVQSGRTRVVDRAAIDLENVEMNTSERMIGDLFEFTPEIEGALLNLSKVKPLSGLECLLDEGVLLEKWLPRSLISYLRETASADESDILIVFRNEAGTDVVQNIERYGDITAEDQEIIARRRGGIVHAMLNRNPLYHENNHFFLPIRNELGMARFLYKSNIGHKILQNMKVHSPINKTR